MTEDRAQELREAQAAFNELCNYVDAWHLGDVDGKDVFEVLVEVEPNHLHRLADAAEAHVGCLEVSDEMVGKLGRIADEAIEENEYAWSCWYEAVDAEADLHRVAPDEPWADLEKHKPPTVGEAATRAVLEAAVRVRREEP